MYVQPRFLQTQEMLLGEIRQFMSILHLYTSQTFTYLAAQRCEIEWESNIRKELLRKIWSWAICGRDTS